MASIIHIATPASVKLGTLLKESLEAQVPGLGFCASLKCQPDFRLHVFNLGTTYSVVLLGGSGHLLLHSILKSRTHESAARKITSKLKLTCLNRRQRVPLQTLDL